jgi:hypothetical protein
MTESHHRVCLDTHVVLDALLDRAPFSKSVDAGGDVGTGRYRVRKQFLLPLSHFIGQNHRVPGQSTQRPPCSRAGPTIPHDVQCRPSPCDGDVQE